MAEESLSCTHRRKQMTVADSISINDAELYRILVTGYYQSDTSVQNI